jgi:hypothetical protein
MNLITIYRNILEVVRRRNQFAKYKKDPQDRNTSFDAVLLKSIYTSSVISLSFNAKPPHGNRKHQANSCLE